MIKTLFLQNKKRLNENIFENDVVKEKVRELLLRIVNFVINQYDIDKKIVKDVVLTGSLATYNWDDYSDIDLHIVLSLKNMKNREKDFFIKYLKELKTNLNEKFNFKIANHKVEIYFQDVEEDHYSLGVYSILKNKWIKHPKHFKVKQNKKLIKHLITDILNEIKFVLTKHPKDWKKIKKLFDDIVNIRKSIFLDKTLSPEEKVYSVNNVVFKILRREGVLELLKNYMNKLKSEQLTL